MIEGLQDDLLVHRLPLRALCHIDLQVRNDLRWLIHLLLHLEVYQTHQVVLHR